MWRVRVAGIELDGAPELPLRGLPIPVKGAVNESKRSVRRPKRLVEGDRVQRRSLRLGKQLAWRMRRMNREQAIRVGNPGVCRRVAWIGSRGLFEVLDRLC